MGKLCLQGLGGFRIFNKGKMGKLCIQGLAEGLGGVGFGAEPPPRPQAQGRSP